jgi:hypothetical protein
MFSIFFVIFSENDGVFPEKRAFSPVFPSRRAFFRHDLCVPIDKRKRV